MQWPTKESDAVIKPYNRNRCKLTNGNCAIDAERQARLYADWALKKGLKKVHVFKRNEHSQPNVEAHMGLAQGGYTQQRLIECNPEDWK